MWELPKLGLEELFCPTKYEAGVLIPICKAKSVLAVSVPIWNNVTDFWELSLGLY